tara:strand:- start:14 stop:628 length:615 start_codon:yes stop_codon:yes gene_type:complete
MNPPTASPVVTTGDSAVGSTKKLTKKQQIIIQRLNQYCKQMGIPDKDIPTIVWSKEEFRQHPVYSTQRGMASKKTLGRCCILEKLIYISYAKHKTLRELDKTLRHELIHYRFFSLNHGKEFDKRMMQLKNGETWGAFYDVDTVITKIKEKIERKRLKQQREYEIWHLLHPTKELKEMVWQFQCFIGRTTGFWHRGIWKYQGWLF